MHEWESHVNLTTNFPRRCPQCYASNWDIGDNVPCAVCTKIVPFPQVHHVDGDHDNNARENRVPICNYCHQGIHQKGFSKRLGATKVRKNPSLIIKTNLEKYQNLIGVTQ